MSDSNNKKRSSSGVAGGESKRKKTKHSTADGEGTSNAKTGQPAAGGATAATAASSAGAVTAATATAAELAGRVDELSSRLAATTELHKKFCAEYSCTICMEEPTALAHLPVIFTDRRDAPICQPAHLAVKHRICLSCALHAPLERLRFYDDQTIGPSGGNNGAGGACPSCKANGVLVTCLEWHYTPIESHILQLLMNGATTATCECGQSGPLQAIMKHASECPKRKIRCRYEDCLKEFELGGNATENPMARLQAAFRAHIEADQCLHMVHCHHSPCNRRNPFVVCAVRGWKDHCFWHERQRVFERQIRSRMSVAVDSLAIGPYSVNLLRAISDGIERSIQEFHNSNDGDVINLLEEDDPPIGAALAQQPPAAVPVPVPAASMRIAERTPFPYAQPATVPAFRIAPVVSPPPPN